VRWQWYLPATHIRQPKNVITNTTLSNNFQAGFFYFPTSGNATTGIVIDRVGAFNNGTGFYIDKESASGATVKASISNSIASANGNGFDIRSATVVSVDASSASDNSGDGIDITSSTVELGRSVLMNNGAHGLNIASGTVNSYRDNRIAGNATGDVVGTPVAATLY
jgi:hypothetical protein